MRKRPDKKQILKAYRDGREAMEHGRAFNPPKDQLLRRAWSEGWADEIMGVDPSYEDVLFSVTGYV